MPLGTIRKVLQQQQALLYTHTYIHVYACTVQVLSGHRRQCAPKSAHGIQFFLQHVNQLYISQQQHSSTNSKAISCQTVRSSNCPTHDYLSRRAQLTAASVGKCGSGVLEVGGW
ncbi:unnamed protein product [Ceratitis capitata]|uniref:(Mediterranean fruit fly) hypothetical protein n=1 Tax=Ceratitis capitata TaxID=7213 RepID=A0A811VGV1_CERCA|nr:unnamed protein product [Ceratitis capitata]